MGFRQVELFLHAVAQTHAQPFAATEGDQCLGQLIASAELVGPRVGKVGQTRHSIRLHLNQQHHCADGQDHHQGKAEQPDAAKEQHRRRGPHHHDGGTEVRLHQQQARHRQQHDERLEEAHPAFTHFFLATHQITGEVDHHEHLGDLGRLDVEETESDPAHRTVHFTADPRDDHHHQQAERPQQHQPAQALPGGNRDHHGDDAGTQAQHHVNKVANHVIQGAARLHGRHFGRCRGDHDQPQAEQRQATGEHREVEVDTAPGDERRWIRLDDAFEAHARSSTAWTNW
ncbi:hypothetical protein D3C73_1077660 [compost metagenome]